MEHHSNRCPRGKGSVCGEWPMLAFVPMPHFRAGGSIQCAARERLQLLLRAPMSARPVSRSGWLVHPPRHKHVAARRTALCFWPRTARVKMHAMHHRRNAKLVTIREGWARTAENIYGAAAPAASFSTRTLRFAWWCFLLATTCSS